MIRAAFLAPTATVDSVYDAFRRDRIGALVDLYPEVVAPDRLAEHLPALHDVDVLFSTWGMPRLTPEQLDALPNLRAVFYAAGSVQGFAAPLLERGITVVSAWQANAVPVAEFTLSQILLSTKGYFRNTREYRANGSRAAFRGPGNYGETVALLGAGAIGRRVIQLLKPFHLNVVLFDPFIRDDDLAELGVERVSLEAAFERGIVVSNHIADKPETAGLIHGGLLNRLRPDATFINTGRGRTVVEADLVETLRARPDLSALLDVTFPEPVPSDSPLWALPNVIVSSHIAGSIRDEVHRMADYCIDEFIRWSRDEPLRYAVSTEMLARMA